jgi:septum formation protein
VTDGAAIYLASKSPRRRELLTQLGVRFEPLMFRDGPRADPETDESVLPGESPDEYVRRVARAKAQSGWQRLVSRDLRKRPVLAADTTVCLGLDIHGKPADAADAARILRELSGQVHRVLTAVAVALEHRLEVEVSESRVTFCVLDARTIRDYVQSGEPMDKAGAYAIQGRAGAFVERLDGSYTGVMGLPLFETARLLRQFGVAVP